MGTRSWGASDWATYSTVSASASAATSHHEVYKARELDSYLDPRTVIVRESRDSAANPNSTPVILALDVTGSMGRIAHTIAATGLGTIIKETFDRKPISDPHIMFAGIGDVEYDRAPLQVSQFEADIRICEQLTKLFVEGGGGGNNFESYNLMWHFAAFHTSCDAFEKHGRKGFLFTIGDEEVPEDLTEENLKKVYGREQEVVASNRVLLEALESKYHVFHLMIEQGSHMRHSEGRNRVVSSWTSLLGQRALLVTDYTKLGEIIVSTMQVASGADPETVAKTWSGDTSVVVANATRGLKAYSTGAVATTGSTVML